jgi:hypothetical protein
MSLAGSSEPSIDTSFPQTVISATVNALIAQRGYFAVIDKLVSEVYWLGEVSLADPENRTKLRDFDLWAHAVRAAILKHDCESTFGYRVSSYDHDFAKQMKISLD